MTRRLILHIGPGKTGTSTFQSWLRENAEGLFEQGLAVPTDFASRSGNMPLLGRAMMLPSVRGADADAIRRKFRAYCEETALRDVIVSSEFLSQVTEIVGWENVPPSQAAAPGLRPPPLNMLLWDKEVAAELMSRFIAYVGTLPFDAVEVIYCVREISGALSSRHAQGLRTFRRTTAYPGLDPERLPLIAPASMLSRFSQAGWSIHLLPFLTPRRATVPLTRRLLDTVGWGERLATGTRFDAPSANVSAGTGECIARAHLVYLLSTALSEIEQRSAGAVGQRMTRLANTVPFGPDSPFVAFALDTARALQQRQLPHLEALSCWMSADDIRTASGLDEDLRAQSALRWSDLDDGGRIAVRNWLHAIAEGVEADPELRAILSAADVRRIEDTPAGPHSYDPEGALA